MCLSFDTSPLSPAQFPRRCGTRKLAPIHNYNNDSNEKRY